MSLVSFRDFEDANGKIDWTAYRKAQIDNGEKCCECRSLILFGSGHRAQCEACKALWRDSEVSHPCRIRCPKCGDIVDAYECGLAVTHDGEEDVTCHGCGHKFQVEVSIAYTFRSPARLKVGVEEDQES